MNSFSRAVIVLVALTSYPVCWAEEWKQIKNKDDILVYQKTNPDSSLLAFKGEGDVNAPIERVAAVIFDTTRAPEWIVDLEESKIVKWISKNEYIEYDHVKTPPVIMKDRDFVSLVKMNVDPKTGEMTFQYKSVVDPLVPETRHVRGNLMNTTFVLKPIAGNTKTHVMGEIYCDPKGAVPKWLVNWFQQDWPLDTFKNLRAQVTKTDIRVDAKISELFVKH